MVNDQFDSFIVITEYGVDGDARHDSDRKPDKNARVQRHSFRPIGGLFIQVGGDLSLESVRVYFLLITFVVHFFSVVSYELEVPGFSSSRFNSKLVTRNSKLSFSPT